MSFYATNNYLELPAENPSLIVAFCHLLQNSGKTITPDVLAEELTDFYAPDPATITVYDTDWELQESGTGWPQSKNSILTFAVPNQDGGKSLLYCLIYDPASRTIIDSTDGEVKSAGIYGNPISFVTYIFAAKPATQPQETAVEVKVTPAEPGRFYTVLKNDRMFDIARRVGLTEQELIEHNDLADPYNLKPGTKLRLPIAKTPTPPKPKTVIEVYDTPVVMHVSREAGAQKWHFGNHDTEKDIISGSDMYPQNKEVRVEAVAKVPVGEETWAYYIDNLALGDFKTTGRLRYTIGFACGDLTLGPPPAPAVDEITLSVEDQIKQTLEAIEPPPKPRSREVVPPPPTPVIERKPEPTDEVLEYPNRWRATYVQYRSPQTYIVDLPGDQEEILVHDLEGNRPSKRLRDNGHYPIAGTFYKDGVQYARPLQAVQTNKPSWYGIPMSALTTEEDLYHKPPDLATKLALKKSGLSPIEKYAIPALAVTELSYDRLKFYGRKLLNKNKETK